MFEDKQVDSPTPSKATAPKEDAAALDVIIHTMPKEFYGREVKFKEQPKPVQVATPPPPVAPVAVPKPVAPVASPALPTSKRKGSKLRVILVILLILSLLTVGVLAWAYTQGMFDQSIPAQPVPEAPVAPPVVTPEAPKPTPEPAKPVSGADTDSDGLTNVEELLYGTDFRNPDSDGDTFLDGNEVFHRFDPRGLAPSTLLDTGAVRVLESVELPFAMFYPTSWNPVSTPASQRVTFRSATGAGVNVLWQDKAADTSLESWYETQVGEVDISRLQATTTKEGYAALIGPDERVMYMLAGERIYTLIYDLGEAKTIEFLQTFKMMVNSFKLVP